MQVERTPPHIALGALVVGALLAAGCSAPGPMRPVASADVFASPPAWMARVVFMRHAETFGRGGAAFRTEHVVGEDGRLLGELDPHRWFSVELRPGKHVFYGWHDNYAWPYVSAMRAELAPGRTYYVVVGKNASLPWYQTAVKLDLMRGAAPVDDASDMQPVRTDARDARVWSETHSDAIRARMAKGDAEIAAGKGALLRAGDGFAVHPSTW